MTDIDQRPAAPAPDWLGQTTAVEQSRAVAEVQAAVVVAQRRPRDVQRALREMREVCRVKGMAERAFYSYGRGGSQVTGATIHLARELARIWGNVQYGIAELRRDIPGRYSEMQAIAWDLETNTRAAQTFVVPHARDANKTIQELASLRDIYENAANMGARRLRAQIFAILPSWFTDEAQDICHATLKDGGGIPLPRRIANVLGRFAELGVVQEQIEQHVGRPSARWNEHDLARLGIVFRSIERGEQRVDDVFPPPRVTADEIAAQAGRSATAPAAAPPVEDPPADSGWGDVPQADPDGDDR